MYSNFFNPTIDNECIGFDLITTAAHGDTHLLKDLLTTQRHFVNMVNKTGWSAVMYAAHHGHYLAVLVLLEAGADASCQEPRTGMTPLMMAASNGHTKCCVVLVEKGRVPVNATDMNGRTAAFYATSNGHGSNQVISQLLGIHNNRVTTRDNIMLKPPNSSPRIKVPSIATSNGPSGSGGMRADAQVFTPNFYSPWLVISACDGSSSRQANTPVRGRTLAETACTDGTTPYQDMVHNQAISRKRKIIMSPYEDSPSSRSPLYTPDKANVLMSSQVSPKPPPKNLEKLLEYIGLDIYKELFGSHAIDLYVFATMTDRDLLNLGISPAGHRRKLQLAQLRFRESITITTTQESVLSDCLMVQLEEARMDIEQLRKVNEQLESQFLAVQMTRAIRGMIGKSDTTDSKADYTII